MPLLWKLEWYVCFLYEAGNPPPTGLRELAELGDAADFDPLRYEDVSSVVETRAVRVHELSRDELAAVLSGPRRIADQAFAQVSDDLVVFV
jgi:hypothetical protein